MCKFLRKNSKPCQVFSLGERIPQFEVVILGWWLQGAVGFLIKVNWAASQLLGHFYRVRKGPPPPSSSSPVRLENLVPLLLESLVHREERKIHLYPPPLCDIRNRKWQGFPHFQFQFVVYKQLLACKASDQTDLGLFRYFWTQWDLRSDRLKIFQ